MPIRFSRLFVLISPLLFGCPLAAQPTFVDHAASVLPGVNVDGRSASLADYDDDGDLDLFFQGGSGAHQLFRNDLIENGSLSFTNVSPTVLPSPTGLGPSWSAAWGDYNGDGRVDVFVGQSNTSPSASGDVLRNNGGTGFSNDSVATGLNDSGFHQNVAWNDIDNDRDLDLIIAMEGPEPHEIYLQQWRRHTFTAVGAEVGLQVAPGDHGYGMAIGDTDGDGDLDIYISTCQFGGNIRNHFFVNQLVETGSLGFIDIADSNGTQFMDNSYAAEFHDFDDDGDLDLYMVGADGNPTKMWRNDGENMFTDVETITGNPLLSDVAGDLNGAKAIDYDNDGDLDLYFHDHLVRAGHNKARKLYRNDGDWQFTDVTVAEGLHATNEGGYDSVWGDLDLDGDLDLVFPNLPQFDERVFLSDTSENGNHWLFISLDGPVENTTGIGASLYATLGQGTPEERTLRREANTNAGTFSQSDLPVHFGLGEHTAIDTLQIVWPDGTIQTLLDVGVDQYLTIAYPTSVPGDYNEDGTVNAADYVMWRNHLGQAVSLPNELATPGVVTEEDYDHWLAQFGNAEAGSGAGVPSGVPEPNALLLAAIACVASFSRWARATTGR